MIYVSVENKDECINLFTNSNVPGITCTEGHKACPKAQVIHGNCLSVLC
jgi:hypothetical protein